MCRVTWFQFQILPFFEKARDPSPARLQYPSPNAPLWPLRLSLQTGAQTDYYALGIMTYYHATTREKMPSIQRWGLGGTRNVQKNFDCLDGVYLAADPMLALGFLLERALCGPFLCKTPKDYVAAFVVIVIDGARIDERRLRVDPNIKEVGFWIFNGIVDVASMPAIDADQVMQFSQPAEK